MQLFGIEFKRSSKKEKSGETFVPPSHDDGAIEIETSEGGFTYSGAMSYMFDLNNVPSDEYELIKTYRNISLQLEVDEAIQEIVNEAIIIDEHRPSVSIVLDEVDVSDSIKEKIRAEFDNIMSMLRFKTNGHSIFRKFYVDGRIAYHKVINKEKPQNGITNLVYIDPMYIKLVREFKKKSDSEAELYDLGDVEEYFIFSQTAFGGKQRASTTSNGLKIRRESIAYVTSGVVSEDGRTVLSHLYKAIKPYNNLKLMEDSVVIYRVTRAPERRIFYLDVGNLPKGKADQYLKDVMNRFKNKIVYDVNKGTITNRQKFQSMMEDYWLPRREGGRGTEVTTLPGGQNLSELDDVQYFRQKLYKSLNVPLSRFQQDSTTFNIGRTTEITRDEIKFSKFITRMRNKFSELFDDILKTQIILKRIATEEEWNEWKDKITYSFLEDNYFQELKETEILRERMETVQQLQQSELIGKYYSHDYVRRRILKQTEDEMKSEDEQIEKEKQDKKYNTNDEENF